MTAYPLDDHPPLPSTAVTLTYGCAVSDTFLVVSGVPDALHEDADYTRLFFLNLEHRDLWNSDDWPDQSVVSLCLRKASANRSRALMSLSREGLLRAVNTHEDWTATIDETLAERSLVPSQITAVGDEFVVCGFYGLLYRSSNGGRQWHAFDDGLHRAAMETLEAQVDALHRGHPDKETTVGAPGSRVAHFMAIDGFAANDIYAAGLDGLLMHYDGSGWTALESGATAHLNSLHCTRDGDVVIAGYDGTILRGTRASGFRLISFVEDLTLFTVRLFQGQIYVRTAESVMRLNGTSLETVVDEPSGLLRGVGIADIDNVSDDVLWIVGYRHVWRFDGTTVQAFRHPDNV